MNISHVNYLMEKTRRDYDEIAEEFSATRKTMWPELADLDKYAKAGDKVLDIGCGNGRLFGYLSEKVKDFSYTGIDVSGKLIEIAQKDFAGKGAEFKAFDGINIPYSGPPAGGFDAVFCLATLPHLPGEELRLKFLRNIKKAVKPGGLLIITCWNLWQIKFISNQIKMIANFITDKISGNEQYDWGDFYIPWRKRDGKIVHRYYHSFTQKELGSLLKKSGWEIKELGYKKRHGAKNFNLFAVAGKNG